MTLTDDELRMLIRSLDKTIQHCTAYFFEDPIGLREKLLKELESRAGWSDIVRHEAGHDA